ERPGGQIDRDEARSAAEAALAPFARDEAVEGPYQIQADLQDAMQNLAGIVRREEEMQQAHGVIERLKRRAERVAVIGNREYNPGWHTALDLHNLLTVAEAVVLAGQARKES